MISAIADTAEIFLGLGDPYPKADIVNFISGTTGQSKSTWNNKSDAIFYSYTRAIKEKGLSAWKPSDPAGTQKIVEYVTAETGLNKNDVNTYLLSLYTMANMGKLKTQYWNPAPGFSAYGASQIAEGLKEFISPVATVASEPAKNLRNALLIAAGLTAIGIFASKSFIKEKVKRGLK